MKFKQCEMCVHHHAIAKNVCNKCDGVEKHMPNPKMKRNDIRDNLWKYIQQHKIDHGYPPSYTKIKEHYKCSRSTVHSYMIELEREGKILFNDTRRSYYIKI